MSASTRVPAGDASHFYCIAGGLYRAHHMAAGHGSTGAVLADDAAHFVMVALDVAGHGAVLYEAPALTGDAAHPTFLGIDFANHVDIVHLAAGINGGEQALVLFVEAMYHVADGVAVAPELAFELGDPVGLAAQWHPRVAIFHVDVGIQIVVQRVPVFVVVVARALAEVFRDVGQLRRRLDDHDIAFTAIRGVKAGLRLRLVAVGVVGPRPLRDRAQQGKH